MKTAHGKLNDSAWETFEYFDAIENSLKLILSTFKHRRLKNQYGPSKINLLHIKLIRVKCVNLFYEQLVIENVQAHTSFT